MRTRSARVPSGAVQQQNDIRRAPSHLDGTWPSGRPLQNRFRPYPAIANAIFTEHNPAGGTTLFRLPANPGRVYLFILNTSAAIIYVSLTGQNAQAGIGFPILAATATALGFYEATTLAPVNTITINGACYVCEAIIPSVKG